MEDELAVLRPKEDEDIAILDTFSLFSKLSIDKSIISKEEGGLGDNDCQHIYSGQSTTIYCLEDPDNQLGGRTGAVAIKTHSEEFPTNEQVSSLDNEYMILRHLSNCVAVRRALKETSNDGVKTIYLEWAEGIPLKKILTTGVRDPRNMMGAARSVARAIADVHDAGVVHNNLTLDNIIVNEQSQHLNDSIKIIDFASASVIADDDKHFSTAVKNDLVALGAMLFEFFSGQSPFQQNNASMCFDMLAFDEDDGAQFDDEERHISADNTLLSQNAIYSKLAPMVPLCLLKLILNLMEVQGTSQRYQSARAVEQDLNSFGDLASFVSDKSFGQLKIYPDKLYDQAHQVSLLTSVCSRIVSANPPEMVLISGRSGTGKSVMFHNVKKAFSEKEEVVFISGKFDQLQQGEPLAAILSAFSRYFSDLAQKSQLQIDQVRTALIDAVGADLAFFVQAIPSLGQITGKPPPSAVHVGGTESENYFYFIFEKFTRAIATPSHPIVLHLDDLHWADELSLKLIKALVTDTRSKCFLFVGCFRDDEVNDEHPLALVLNEIGETVPITNINTTNISKESMNEFVSDALQMLPHSTKSLAELAYRKTGGNGLIATQFLQTLWNEGSLQFLLENNTWAWDTKAIEAKSIPDDAVELMIEKILQLPVTARHSLQCLSCLGSSCLESTYRLITDQGEASDSLTNESLTLLDLMIEEGLLNKEGAEYKFAHDQIQQAAYSLIPNEKRDYIHLQIGNKLLEHTPEHELDSVLSIAVDQLNRGTGLIDDKEKKVQLAMLNLRAGEKSISLGTFQSSTLYLKMAIDMLDEDAWDEQYDLALRLHSIFAESLYCTGQFPEVGQITGIVILRAKSIGDKLSAYSTLIKAVGAKKKLTEAIQIGLDILNELGEPISVSNASMEETMAHLVKLTKEFGGMTDKQFMALKRMEDDDKIAAMKILGELVFQGLFENQLLLLVILDRMMQLSLMYGICEDTCTAFSSIAFLFSGIDKPGAYRIGRLALAVIDMLQLQQPIARAYASVYGGIHHFFERMETSLEPHMHAYQLGMRCGEVMYAITNAYFYVGKSSLSGSELTSLAKDGKLIVDQATKYKQVHAKYLILTAYDFVLRLIGDSELVIEESAFSSDKLLETTWCFFRSIAAYVYCDYDVALEMLEKKRECEKKLLKGFSGFATQEFYEALIFLAQQRKTGNEEWMHRVQESVLGMKKTAQFAESHFHHRFLLLEAETTGALGDVEKATQKYELAVRAAEEFGYINEHAIASERAGDFFLSQGDERATKYYGKAQELYIQWGARGKADELCKNIPF